MAKLVKTSGKFNWEWQTKDDIDTYFKKAKNELNRLHEISEKVDLDGDLTGVMISFPVADGRAFYRVYKDNPISLEHIPFGDAWEIEEAHIRGLRKQDIIKMAKSARAIAKLFSPKVAVS